MTDTVNLSLIRKELDRVNTFDNPTLAALCRKVSVPSDFDSWAFAEELNDIPKDSVSGQAEYLGRGAFRACFETNKPGWVVKLPRDEDGAFQNILEAFRFDILEPLNLAPKHRLVWINDIPVLYVEKLTKMDSEDDSNHNDTPEIKIIKEKLGIRDWIQTGLTPRGNRVFSDIGH